MLCKVLCVRKKKKTCRILNIKLRDLGIDGNTLHSSGLGYKSVTEFRGHRYKNVGNLFTGSTTEESGVWDVRPFRLVSSLHDHPS